MVCTIMLTIWCDRNDLMMTQYCVLFEDHEKTLCEIIVAAESPAYDNW
jgi:hypothetical protein